MGLAGAVLTECCTASVIRNDIAGVVFFECSGCGKVISPDDPHDRPEAVAD